MENENEREQLKQRLSWMADFTSDIQTEIACALLQDDKVKQRVSKQLNGCENEMLERLNAVIYGFIGAMPLASMNMTNLFMAMLSYHSNITKDPILKEIIREIGEENAKLEEANV